VKSFLTYESMKCIKREYPQIFNKATKEMDQISANRKKSIIVPPLLDIDLDQLDVIPISIPETFLIYNDKITHSKLKNYFFNRYFAINAFDSRIDTNILHNKEWSKQLSSVKKFMKISVCGSIFHAFKDKSKSKQRQSCMVSISISNPGSELFERIGIISYFMEATLFGRSYYLAAVKLFEELDANNHVDNDIITTLGFEDEDNVHIVKNMLVSDSVINVTQLLNRLIVQQRGSYLICTPYK